MKPCDQPNVRDIADFATLALSYGLIDIQAVRSWADSLIAATNHPPIWAIDLAFATKDDVEDQLRHVPGQPRNDMIIKLLFAKIAKLWREGKVDIGTVRRAGWHCSDELPVAESCFGLTSWGTILNVFCEEWEGGWSKRSELEIRHFIDISLAQHEKQFSLLPACFQ